MSGYGATMADATPGELLEEAVRELLGTGPMPLATLLERLDERGRLRYLRADGVAEDGLAEAVIDAVVVSDAVWPTPPPDRVLALSSLLVDGIVLTHRLSAEELELGEVFVTPDLVVLDWDRRDGLDLDDGGRLVHMSSMTHVPGEDRSTVGGRGGWLDGFAAGDLIAFTRTGSSVAVKRVDDVADGDREVALLQAAVDARIPPGQGDEAVPIILDALAADPGAFRCPVRPLGELLVAAGLERRGFSFGRAGERWRSFGEQYQDSRRDRLVERWEFDTCCAGALDEVRETFASFNSDAADGLDVGAVTGALAHGAVAPAFVELVLGDREDGDERLASFANSIVGQAPATQTAPARFLSALERDRRGDALGSEAAQRGALRADPDFGPAALALADYEIDRGDLRRALTLLRHADLTPAGSTLEVLEGFRSEMAGPYQGVGRNDRCPCGSSRKFKACCQRNPRVPLSVRTRLVSYKLARFVGRDHRRSRLVGVASAACDPDGPELLEDLAAMARNPLILDFVTFEGGGAEQYLAERGDLLPVDERELLERLVDEPRRVWEITDVAPGTGMTLRDTTTGDTLAVAERLGSQDRAAGELLLARVARFDDQNQIMGVPVEIPLRLRDSALALVDSHPDAEALARWYGEAIAFPRLVNREGEPLVLCHTGARNRS